MSKKFLIRYMLIFVVALVAGSIILYNLLPGTSSYSRSSVTFSDNPELNSMPESAQKTLIIYGRELIIHTGAYLGPKGSIAHISNGMSCGNCHLDGGIRNNANAYVPVASTYPKFRERSGIVESISFRINDCMLRSLNGKMLDTLSREMSAMVAYIRWTAQAGVSGSGKIAPGTPELALISRAASATTGKEIFAANCISCHGANGEGALLPDSIGYRYPPLWGVHSYNISAGMFRLSKLAGFIKYNMPYTEQQSSPILTDEQAWDVAAFINSQERPEIRFPGDWPRVAAKPFDYPFGPYIDNYSEEQHKFGPYGRMKESMARLHQKSKF